MEKPTGPLALGGEGGATFRRTPLRRSGAVVPPAPRSPGWGVQGVVDGRLESRSARCDLGFSTTVDVLWTSLTRRNALSERGTAVVGRVRQHPAGPGLRTGVAHELRGRPSDAPRRGGPHPRRPLVPRQGAHRG